MVVLVSLLVEVIKMRHEISFLSKQVPEDFRLAEDVWQRNVTSETSQSLMRSFFPGSVNLAFLSMRMMEELLTEQTSFESRTFLHLGNGGIVRSQHAVLQSSSSSESTAAAAVILSFLICGKSVQAVAGLC